MNLLSQHSGLRLVISSRRTVCRAFAFFSTYNLLLPKLAYDMLILIE